MVSVLISEWARKAAHELDDWRDRWLASKERDLYLEPPLWAANIKGDLDHEEIISNKELATKYIGLLIEDIHLLQDYLTELKGGSLGGGR